MENKIIKTLRGLGKLQIDGYVGTHNDFTYKFDFIEEFLFISTTHEEINNIDLDNYFGFENTTLYDLQDLDYDENTLKIIYDLLIEVKENYINER